MKNIYISLCILLLSLTTAKAQVIASEDFDYTDGSSLSGANGGTGWGNAWTLVDGTAKNVVNDTILNYRTGKASGSFLNLAVTAAGENVRYERALTSTITDDGNTYWMAFSLDILEAGGNVSNLVLVDTAGTGDDGFKFIVGRLFDGKIAVGAPGNLVRANGVNALQPNWLVTKISFTGDDTNDTLRLFVNPDPTVEPTNEMAAATFAGGKLNTGEINGIMIRAEADPTIVARYDDIYLGNSYVDIAPATAVDIARYSPIFEKFDYTADADVVGNGASSGGWAGPWEQTGGVAQNVVDEQIENNNLLLSTAGNSLLIDATLGSTRLTRPLAETYKDNGLTYWLSFSMDFRDADQDGGVVNVMLINNDSETMGSGGPAGQFVGIGKSNSAGATGIMSYDPFKFEEKIPGGAVGGNWFVARIETNGTADHDTVRLYVNPDPGTEPTVGAEDLKFIAEELNGGWKAIGIKNDGGATKSRIDDIYLALDFKDVVPDDLQVIDNAPNPAFEKFDYAAETVIDQANPLGVKENGWNGPWTSVTGQTKIIDDSVSNNFNLRATSANSMEFARTGTEEVRIYRGLETSYEDNGRTYWMGYWLNAEATATGAGILVMLGDTATYGASGPGGQFVWTGLLDNSLNLQLRETGLGTQIDTGVPGDTARWIVLKIETNGTSNADSIRMFVDPVPGSEPSDDQAIGVIGTTTLNGGWNGILAKITGGQNNLSAVLDNLYIGNSFAEITPDDLSFVDVAPVPAFDKFNYTAGDSISVTKTLGSAENGWSGPWQSVIGGVVAAEDRVENQFNLKSTQNNALLFQRDNTDEVRIYRGLESPYLDNGRTYWMGFWYKASVSSTGEGFLVMLGDTATYGASGPGGQLVWVGTLDNSTDIQINIPGEGTTNTQVAGDTTHWLVLKIETTGDAEEDSVRLFIDPATGTQPQDSEAVVSLGTSALSNGWNGIMAKITGGANTTRAILDNLYLGNSFAEITPDDLTDIQQVFLPEPVYEPFDYTATANLDGQGDFSEGWGGSWTKTSGDDVVIGDGNVESEYTEPTGNKAFVNYTSEAIAYDRSLQAKYEDNGGDVWISFLMDFEEVSKISTEAQIVLTNGGDELLRLGRTEGFNRLGFNWGTDVFDYISNVPSEGTNWVVAKIEMSGNDSPENIYMWVNPDPTRQPSLTQADVASDENEEQRLEMNDGFDGIRIKTSGGTPISLSFDEVRLGFTFSDVSKLEEEIPEGLIAREQFIYDFGLDLNGLGGAGSQWAGPWELIGGEGTIADGNLTVSGVSLNVVGNSAIIGSTESKYARLFSSKIEDDGNGYWLSYTTKYEAPGLDNVAQGVFANTIDFSASSDQAMRILLGKKFNATVFSILDLNNGGLTAESASPVAEASWVVSHVQFTGDAEADSIWLWINPDPTTTPSKDNADAFLLSTALNEGFNGLIFRTGGSAADLMLDEIYFGNSFEAVAPVGSGGNGPITGLDFDLDEKSNLYNFPNPMTDYTNFIFNANRPGHYVLEIYDVNGQLVKELFRDQISVAGKISVQWDRKGMNSQLLPGGLYIYKLTNEDWSASKRLIITR